MKGGSLFSGIAGLDLGLEAHDVEPEWFCESDPDCRRILERHYPGVPIYTDIRELDDSTPRVEVVPGGFPCQPISNAGLGLAQADERWLWPEFDRVIRLLRPRYVVVENVSALLRRGLGLVLADLAAAGYDASWRCLRASDVGAPHRRERLFLVATDTDEPRPQGQEPAGRRDVPAGRRGSAAADSGSGRRRERPEHDGTTQRALTEHEIRTLDGDGLGQSERPGVEMAWGAYEPAVRRWEYALGRPAPRPTDDRGRLAPEFVEWMLGFPADWTEDLSRTARLRTLGNSVQVQVAEVVGAWLREIAA